MTDHIEVVTEAHSQGVDCTFLTDCPVCAALDSLEAELAQAREENALLRRSLKVLADDLALTGETEKTR